MKPSIRKGGVNNPVSQITERPAPPVGMSNNPPDVVLELTNEQARFLLDNCNSNIEFALNAMMAGELSRPALEKLVTLSEQFKEVRGLLRKQGVRA